MGSVSQDFEDGGVIVDSPEFYAEAKSEDDLRDTIAEKVLESKRLAALAATTLNIVTGKRKRSVEEKTEERAVKRRRQQPAAVLLDTGRVKTMSTATTLMNLRPMLYLSASMRWAPGPPLGVRRGACAAVLLDESRLLVVGGNEGKNSMGSTEVLDFRESRTMTFRPGPMMYSQRRECAVIGLDESHILVVGGYDGSHFLNTTEIIDVRTLRVAMGPRLITRRAAPGVARLSECGYILVCGGKNAFGCLDSTEVLDIKATTLEFKPGPSLNIKRAGPATVPIDESRIIVIGGHDSARTHNTTEIVFAAATAKRSSPKISVETGPMLGTPRSYFASVLLNAGNLQIIGGHDGYNYLSTTDVLNLDTLEFTTGPKMKKRRFMCAAAPIAEDRVIVVGGTEMSEDHHSTEMLVMPTYSFVPAPWMKA